MKIPDQLRTTLKSGYFDLITEVNADSCEDLWTGMIEKLKASVSACYAAIYLYDPSLESYQLKSRLPEEINFLKESLTDTRLMYIKPPKAVKPYIIHLDNDPEEKVFIFVAFEKACDSDILDMIKTETENIIRIVSEFSAERKKKKRETILADLASHLLSFTSKEDILNEVTKLLKDVYPEYTLHLLLARDVEPVFDLPVKTMEYNEDITLKCGLHAFMSGEVRSEKDKKGNIVTLYAPLTGNQGVYGVFQVRPKKEMYIPELEAGFLSKLAHTTGKAMEKAILYENSTGLVADLKLLNDATHALNSNLKLAQIIKYVRNQVMDLCHATQVGFILYKDQMRHSFEILQGSTAFFSTDEGSEFAAALLDEKTHYNEAVFNSTLKDDERFNYRSVMVIPMHHGGEMHGMIAIMHEESNYFTFDMFKLLQALIRHSSLALSNALLTEKLEKAVITDYLTKLYSRNYLEEQIAKYQSGTLILFDIDDFKVVNDTYGHHVGDEVLKKAADIIRSYTDTIDVAARWGGEELALYAPNISLSQGVQVASLILKKVKENTTPSVTLSSGVSSWDHTKNDSASDIFIRADRALYEAKNGGKNSVVKN